VVPITRAPLPDAKRSGSKVIKDNQQLERAGYSIPEWGARYKFGRSKSYALVRTGRGPRTVVVGATKIILAEDDEAWREALRSGRKSARKAAARDGGGEAA
jgi:hypothetical protein